MPAIRHEEVRIGWGEKNGTELKKLTFHKKEGVKTPFSQVALAALPLVTGQMGHNS